MANEKDSSYFTTSIHKGWLIGAAGVIAAVVILGIGMVAGRASWRFQPNGGFKAMGLRAGGPMLGGRFYGGPYSNQNRLSGVVTAVSSSGFTLAGNGSTNSVNTNNSTVWQGASSVKVNDSVIVAGTVANGSYTATEVIVNP